MRQCYNGHRRHLLHIHQIYLHGVYLRKLQPFNALLMGLGVTRWRL
jgi:hypothetical protein